MCAPALFAETALLAFAIALGLVERRFRIAAQRMALATVRARRAPPLRSPIFQHRKDGI